MSKILEFDAILKENLKDIHFRSPDQTYESVLHCMVVAYNRAIDDAVGEMSKPEHQIELGVINGVLKLKI